MNNPAVVGPFEVGSHRSLLVIAGPCVLQDEELALHIAKRLRELAGYLPIHLIFKASFDKANRTSVESYRGPGLDRGLQILARVKETWGTPVTTDIHLPEQAAPAAEVCDLLQIPAFLARQTDLLMAAARTGRAVHVKKGQFMAPDDMRHVIAKLEASGCHNILLCERGTFFGYGQLVNDMARLGADASNGCSRGVRCDAQRATAGRFGFQRPGASGKWWPRWLGAATAVGIDGLFFETHPDPDASPSDGPNMVPLDEVERLLRQVLAVREAVTEES